MQSAVVTGPHIQPSGVGICGAEAEWSMQGACRHEHMIVETICTPHRADMEKALLTNVPVCAECGDLPEGAHHCVMSIRYVATPTR